jgi:hypothetical protein
MRSSNRWRRYSDWDERPLRLDRFAREDPANGFAAFRSPADPTPGMTIKAGRIASMDGVLAHDFDMIDAFIAEYHLDPEIAPEAMAMESARWRACWSTCMCRARGWCAGPWHDAGKAGRRGLAPQCAGDRLRLFQDAGRARRRATRPM